MTSTTDIRSEPKWRAKLRKELDSRREFQELSESQWRTLLKTRKVTSSNYDTVLALDWPHYCTHSTSGCGGSNGWCYTFQGHQAGKNHDRHVGMVDVLARRYPILFAEKVQMEVTSAVKLGKIPYANLRYSGSGEVIDAYLPALIEVQHRGIHLWGFTRNIQLALNLRELGISVLVSFDKTTPQESVDLANSEGLDLAYTSIDAEDFPKYPPTVTFPLHRNGRVSEVVDNSSICPKVLAEFYYEERPTAVCQSHCHRCHL